MGGKPPWVSFSNCYHSLVSLGNLRANFQISFLLYSTFQRVRQPCRGAMLCNENTVHLLLLIYGIIDQVLCFMRQ